MNEKVIDENPLVVYENIFKQPELRACNGPVFRGVLTAATAEIPGRSESRNLDTVNDNGNIARPYVVIVTCFAANFKRKVYRSAFVVG